MCMGDDEIFFFVAKSISVFFFQDLTDRDR